MKKEKNLLAFLGSANSSPYFAKLFFGIGIFLCLMIIGAKCFAHVHLEIEVPEHVWDKMEKEKNEQAYERVQKDPENASDRDKEKATKHEWDNRG